MNKSVSKTDELPVAAGSECSAGLGVNQKVSKFIVQRRFQGGFSWEDHAYPKNDFESAKACIAECRKWEIEHSKLPGKMRLIRVTTEIFDA